MMFLNESLSSMLTYMLQQYAEAMARQYYLSCIPYATYSREQTGNIIRFAQFEEDNLLSETRNNTESGNESGDDSTLAQLSSEE